MFFENESQIEYDDKVFAQNKILFADTAFFNVFDYKLIVGSHSEILSIHFTF